MKWMSVIGVVLVAIGLSACGSGSKGGEKAAAPEAPAKKVEEKPVFTAGAVPITKLPSSGLPGKVMEVHTAGGYTYLWVRTMSGDLWAATAVSKVEVGAEVVVPAGTLMEKFTSKSLGRTFDRIFFVDHIKGTEPLAGPSSAPSSGPAAGGKAPAVVDGAPSSAPASGAASKPSGPNPHEAVSPGAGTPQPKVDLAELTVPDGGIRVDAAHARRTELSGKKVSIRGRVVKSNPQIMGKTWIHIQDGSGDATKGTHDLTITTAATNVPVGKVVLVEGVLAADRDFGSGYRFAVIVEDAKVTVE